MPHNIKETEKDIPGFVLLSGSTQEFIGVYSGPILHPSFVEIHFVILCDKPVNKCTPVKT